MLYLNWFEYFFMCVIFLQNFSSIKCSELVSKLLLSKLFLFVLGAVAK